MKKLTDIIKENEQQKTFSYKIYMEVSGMVFAVNEGHAGEQVDKEYDLIDQILSESDLGVSCDNYEILEINEMTNPDSIGEKIDNNKVLESLDADREGELYQYAQSIAQMILNAEGEVYDGFEEREYVIKEIVRQFNSQITREPVNDESTEENEIGHDFDGKMVLIQMTPQELMNHLPGSSLGIHDDEISEEEIANLISKPAMAYKSGPIGDNYNIDYSKEISMDGWGFEEIPSSKLKLA